MEKNKNIDINKIIYALLIISILSFLVEVFSPGSAYFDKKHNQTLEVDAEILLQIKETQKQNTILQEKLTILDHRMEDLKDANKKLNDAEKELLQERKNKIEESKKKIQELSTDN
jgi:hypothetical protein